MPKRYRAKISKKTLFSIPTKRQKTDPMILWVLWVTFIAITGAWLLQGTITDSFNGSISLVYQKVMNTLNHRVNDLETTSYVQNIENSSGEFDPSNTYPIWDNVVLKDQTQQLAEEKSTQVLAANTTADGKEKWIEVDLSDQRLYAHEGDGVVYNFLVSSGKSWTPTPTGEFRVWIKLRYANMVGGSKKNGDYYNLPNVPYVMYFYQGYGIHGAYWHMNFGHPMSHGCINMKPNEAGKIYEWAGPVMPEGKSVVKSTADNPGIRIVIHK